MHPPARLAVVGHRAELGTCLPPEPLAGLEVGWVERPVDPDPAALRAAVERLRPDVVAVLEPQAGDGALLDGLGAVRLAWLVADCDPSADDGARCADFDRVVAASAGAARRAPDCAPWRIEPLPVSDALFAAVGAPGTPPRVFFDGPTCPRRDTILQPTKHNFDVLHLAGGGTPERLGGLIGRCDVALDLREEPGVALRDRVGTALAAGLLVIAESPLERPGLLRGHHVLTFANVWDLHDILLGLRRHPDAMRSLRVRGRRHAERLRASVALPRLVAEVLAG